MQANNSAVFMLLPHRVKNVVGELLWRLWIQVRKLLPLRGNNLCILQNIIP